MTVQRKRAGRPKAALVLTAEEKEALERYARGRTRARVADAEPNVPWLDHRRTSNETREGAAAMFDVGRDCIHGDCVLAGARGAP